MTPIYFDFETRSPIPIRLGVDNYFSRAEPLILTYAIGDGPVQIVDYLDQVPQPCRDLPLEFKRQDLIFIAHNAQFDRRVLERLFGCHIPLERFRCTQAQAYAHGLPGSLETLGEVLGIKQKKLTGDDGHKLMLFFCTPRSIWKDGTPVWNEPHEHPEKWERFKQYAIRDVEALRECHKKLPTWNYQLCRGLEEWFLDQRINERGFAFDKHLATQAQAMLEGAKGKQQRYAQFVTDGSVASVTQRQKLLDWFNASGLEIASMKASDIREALESDDLPPHHRFLLELRLEGSKSSGSKYRRGLECVGADGRIRDTMLFSGANRTGRWSGRNFQPQNLPRPSAHWEDLDKENPWKPIEQIGVPLVRDGDVAAAEAHGGVNTVCNDIIRSCIVAELGNEFVSADWANIESRFLAWCTNNQWKLDYFRAVDRGDAPDAYKALWARLFGIRVEDVTKLMRQAAKVIDLSLGYLGGVGALITMAIGNGADMSTWPELVLPKATPEQLKKAHRAWRRAFINGEDFGVEPDIFRAAHIMVQLYREANAAVVDEGYHIGKVVQQAMEQRDTLFRAAKCDIWYNGNALIIQLPSGRRLFYWSPHMRQEDEEDPETGEVTTRSVFYFKASRGKQWRWLKSWPGQWIENICQSGCNDVLRIGMLEVQKYCLAEPRIAAWLATLPVNARTPLVLHVHDEPTAELPRGLLSYEKLEWLLTDNLIEKYSWLRGIPLAASGWIGSAFRK